jgi:hypothetical protein
MKAMTTSTALRSAVAQLEANSMNKRLNEALTRVKALPDEQQAEVAALLFDFLERGHDIYLTPGQVAEIERNLADSEPYASESEVRALFQRLGK